MKTRQLTKYGFMVFLLVLGCKNIRYTYLTGEPFYFNENPTLIVLPLAEGSDRASLSLYKSIFDHLDEECVSVLFLPQMDYDLKLRNIDETKLLSGDEASLSALNDWIPNAYLLEMKLTGMPGPQGAKTPVGKSKWIAKVESVGTAEVWEYQTDSQITSVKLNAKDVNMFASPYQMGIKESLNYLIKNAMPGCK